MIPGFKLILIGGFCGTFLLSDTKSYEKDLKLNIALTQLGALSDRGINVSITNSSAKNDHDISVLAQLKSNDCPLYVSFTGFRENGEGKWEELPCKYRAPTAKDYKVETQVQSIKAGRSFKLFSMLFSPKQIFVVDGPGSIKLVAHYKYQKRELKDVKMSDEANIPSFVLHSDTLIFNIPK